MRWARRSAVAAVAVVLVSCGAFEGPGDGGSSDGSGRTRVSVIGVVDGDTIHVDLLGDEVTIRIIGIDTPEKDGPYTQQECFGDESTHYTEDALGGRDVELEFDVERIDRFDRTLAYIWVGDSLFNEAILRVGFAVVATFPPNVRYVERFIEAQRAARDDGAGLWGACAG
jgi:micrococcal nuclease